MPSRSYASPIGLRPITPRYRPVALGVTVMTHLRSFDELALTDDRNREESGTKLHKRSQRRTLLQKLTAQRGHNQMQRTGGDRDNGEPLFPLLAPVQIALS
jgi:hypothetical protein